MSETSNKTIAKNTLFLYARMLVVLVVSLFTTRIILKALGATDYGIYNVVGGVVTIMVFLNGALSASSSRFLTYELGKDNKEGLFKTFSAALNLHLCVAALVVIIGETLGVWLLYNKLVIPPDRLTAAFWVLQCSIVSTIMSFVQVPYTASIISHENMSIYAYVGLYEAFAKLLIAYLITVSPIDRLIFYAILLMVNSAIIQSFYWIYTKNRYAECRFRPVKDKTLYKSLLSYCGWELFGGLASVCQGQGLSIVLNIFFGPVVNAARAIVSQIQSAVQQFVSNFLTAARPQVIKRSANQDYEGMYSLSFTSAKFAYLLMFALVVPICFEIKFILNVWLGDEVPEYTAVFSVIILVTGLFQSFHTASLMPYHAIGKIKTGNVIGGSLMILSLPISYVLFKMGLPPYWAFIVIFFTNTAQQFTTWIIIHGYVKFSYKRLLKTVYLPCVVVTAIAIIPPLLLFLLMPEGWIRFITLLLVTEICLAVVVLYIGLTKNERERIVTLLKQKLIHARA